MVELVQLQFSWLILAWCCIFASWKTAPISLVTNICVINHYFSLIAPGETMKIVPGQDVVMTCELMAPSHYLNQHRLIINRNLSNQIPIYFSWETVFVMMSQNGPLPHRSVGWWQDFIANKPLLQCVAAAAPSHKGIWWSVKMGSGGTWRIQLNVVVLIFHHEMTRVHQ